MKESNTPSIQDKIIVWIVSFILVSLILLAWKSVIDTLPPIHIVTDAERTAIAPTPILGDELTFPDGWTPVGCDSHPKTMRYNDCQWLCVKDAVYRYCTPVIRPVTDNDSSRGR